MSVSETGIFQRSQGIMYLYLSTNEAGNIHFDFCSFTLVLI